MQPLAIQKASTTTDAGDSGASSNAPVKGAGGAIFNELMAAAAPASGKAGADGASGNANSPASHDAEQTDEAVAALAAASQIASRGVTLKAAPASTDASLTLTTKPKSETGEEAIGSALTEGEGDTKGDGKQSAKTSDHALEAIDPSNMNVQALIHMAVTANLAASEAHADASHVANAHSDKLQQDGEQAADAASAAVDGAVNSLTPPVAPVANSTPQSSEAAITTQQEQAVPPPRIAALQAVAWFDAKAASKVENGGDESASATLAGSTGSLDANASAETTGDKDAKAQADDAATQQAATIDPSAQAIAAVSAPANAAPDNAAQARQSDDADLLLQSRAAQQQWTDSSTMIATSAAGYGAGSTATAAKAVETIKSDMASVDKAVSGAASANGQSSDIRDLAQIAPTTTQATFVDAEDIAAQSNFAPTDAAPKQQNVQISDVRQANAAAGKAVEEAASKETTEAPAKDTVHIRELMKLGVTEATLSQEAQPLAQQVQSDPLPIIPAQDVTSSLAATPQASTLATTSTETNGERRSIADDIRLRALERMVVNAARNGTQTLSIQLYPPGLGQVVLRLAMDGQRLRLTTRASSTEAAETLRNMETDLRGALAGNGLQLTGFDVSEDGTNDEAPHRQQPVEPVVKTRSGGTDESFTVELNA